MSAPEVPRLLASVAEGHRSGSVRNGGMRVTVSLDGGRVRSLSRVHWQVLALVVLPAALFAMGLLIVAAQSEVEPLPSSPPPPDRLSSDSIMLASGIEGQVTLGPTQRGPARVGAPLAAHPHRTTITVLDHAGQQVIRFDTDAEGRFRVPLPPGTYTIRPESTGAFPFAKPQVVTVSADQFTPVQIRYDTGLR